MPDFRVAEEAGVPLPFSGKSCRETRPNLSSGWALPAVVLSLLTPDCSVDAAHHSARAFNIQHIVQAANWPSHWAVGRHPCC